MADIFKPDYIDLDSGAWLSSRTRRKLRDPRLWGIYWEIIHQLNEAGGWMVHDREDLLESTLATPEELDRILDIHHFIVRDFDGQEWLGHVVVIRKIGALKTRLGKKSEAGIRSGEVRRARSGKAKALLPGTPIEHRSNAVQLEGGEDHLSTGLEQGTPFEHCSNTVRTKTDLLSDRETEGLTRERARGAAPEITTGGAPPSADQVKTGSQREPERARTTPRPPGPPTAPPPGARPTTPRTLTPGRIDQLVETCRPLGRHDADVGRPWINKLTATLLGRVPLSDQLAFEDAFTSRYGFGLDTGPQAPGTRREPTNGAEDPGAAAPDATVGDEGGVLATTAALETRGG